MIHYEKEEVSFLAVRGEGEGVETRGGQKGNEARIEGEEGENREETG